MTPEQAVLVLATVVIVFVALALVGDDDAITSDE